MDTSKILFVLGRHGRTAGNEKNLYRGHSNAAYAQLNDDGRGDAWEEGVFLKGLGINFPLIITDDLDRTYETAKIVAGVLGISPENIIRDKRMRPLDMGDWTGKSKEAHPLDAYMKDKNKKIPGGDSLNMLNKRQSSVFADVLETVAKIHAPVLVLGHGTNAGFLHSHVNKKDTKEVGYEGLTYPGGVSVFTKDGITPIFKKRDGEDAKKEATKTPLVQLNKWSVEFVGGKDTNDQPKSCFNCHLLYDKQKTCSILGPDIIISTLKKDGKLYTPVCGEQDAGTPMQVSDEEAKYDLNAMVGPEKADQVGLEWAEGKGTNCGGRNEGAPCKYFDSEDGIDGICLVIGKEENEVDWDDCCAAHDGPAMAWRDAQKLLSAKSS